MHLKDQGLRVKKGKIGLLSVAHPKSAVDFFHSLLIALKNRSIDLYAVSQRH